MTLTLRHLILRYGVFVLLFLMSFGLLFFVCNFELRVKTAIHLFYDNHDCLWHGYITPANPMDFQPQDTLWVVQTPVGDCSYVIRNVELEKTTIHLTLQSLEQKNFSDTYCEGFVFAGRVKIKDKILHRTTSAL